MHHAVGVEVAEAAQELGGDARLLDGAERAAALPDPREQLAARRQLLEQQKLRAVGAHLPEDADDADDVRVREGGEHLNLSPHIAHAHQPIGEALHRHLRARRAATRHVHAAKGPRAELAAELVLRLERREVAVAVVAVLVDGGRLEVVLPRPPLGDQRLLVPPKADRRAVRPRVELRLRLDHRERRRVVDRHPLDRFLGGAEHAGRLLDSKSIAAVARKRGVSRTRASSAQILDVGANVVAGSCCF